MKLSIIIVNYNVRYFLEQCLHSVFKAIKNIDAEVFVVDNDSYDNSMEMVKNLFPEVIRIENKKNVGFSKANNQAISITKGEYVLLLNPDTVVEEDAFEKCINFMDKNPNAGGLGVKMVDGNGVFLPESKRGLPTPSVSFYKIFGLSSIFPKSKKFAKYHLGYLNDDEINEIEILSGAYMWMRKSVLDKIGYLDESFFMYGEDIDLSYRIIKAGYKNYYFPETKIIHYKGESTKKGSINYVFVFYNAMIIFSKKHFASNAKAFSFFINIAIYLRALLAIIVRFIKTIRLPLFDVAIISLVLMILNELKPFFGFPNQIAFSNNYGLLNVLAVIGSFLIGIALTKGYASTVKLNQTFLGVVIGAVILFCTNAFFPHGYSFSNKFLISIIAGITFLIPLIRLVLNYFNQLKVRKNNKKVFAISGYESFINEAASKIQLKNPNAEILNIKPDNNYQTGDAEIYIAKSYQLPDINEIYNVSEVVFSSEDNSYKEIIDKMVKTKNKFIDFKIFHPKRFVIGSQSIEKIS